MESTKVPLDTSYSFFKTIDQYKVSALNLKKHRIQSVESEALRIFVKWDQQTNQFRIIRKVFERTATESMRIRSTKQPRWGSFKANIQTMSGQDVYFDSIGTGQVYKYISNVISFRFPAPIEDFIFSLSVENSINGNQEVVLTESVKLSDVSREAKTKNDQDFYMLKKATKSPSIEFIIFAEGFLESRVEYFLQNALRTVDILKVSKFPNFENINFKAVFKKSNLTLGRPLDYGNTPIKRDSAYGLYYIYWYKFGRWYNVIYPTDEEYFRSAMSEIPYDYILFLVDSFEYWGVGNYKTHTAVPVGSHSFIYLLLHELGHYFGLNEEYDGGGPTELEFAKNIHEVWSQNMTFLPNPKLEEVKWTNLISDHNTPIPTPFSYWKNDNFGAYNGGYADSNESRSSYKPGLRCVMDSSSEFCQVCLSGISDVVKFDLGL